ncbi:hypothetical protein [Bacillus cereus]|uniref:hypothetical protein n=1 Tax=Bacillus cereus TaxID=1396 RepID=UPI000BED1F74|nr:hypothetical protein [Bacillus cereus]PDY19552.1 hypothetical protein COM76_09410 [Bacillus cereus]
MKEIDKKNVKDIKGNGEAEIQVPDMIKEAIEKSLKKYRFLMMLAPPIEDLQKIENIILKQEAEMWCLDFPTIADIMDELISIEMIPEYIENKLESYIGELLNDPMFRIHAPIIKEAYKAYNLGLYKLCVFPLLATFEHVFSSWCEGKIKIEMISIDGKPNSYGLYKKVNPEEYKKANEEYFTQIFTNSILRMYKKLFLKIPNELGKELNRNSIMHGFYDYESITKKDVLKLFQLLKSTMILKKADSHQLISKG